MAAWTVTFAIYAPTGRLAVVLISNAPITNMEPRGYIMVPLDVDDQGMATSSSRFAFTATYPALLDSAYWAYPRKSWKPIWHWDVRSGYHIKLDAQAKAWFRMEGADVRVGFHQPQEGFDGLMTALFYDGLEEMGAGLYNGGDGAFSANPLQM